MATFGIIISNRSFFPDHLVRTAREKLLAALDAWGHQYVTLSPEDTCMGQTMTYDEAVKCAELFRRPADEIAGIIVCLPNFGEETGVSDAAGWIAPFSFRHAMTIWTNCSWKTAATPFAASSLCATTFTSTASSTR